MERKLPGRRSFLKKMAALGAVGVPGCTILAPGATHAAGAGKAGNVACDTAARFDLEASEVEFRKPIARARW